jgi:2-polyprenyl-6-methoxyphenol hydroxylase-like FAD-dependent oxidoreductase
MPHAVIVGGSIGGLFCALLLRRAGWTVEILERSGRGLSGRGAGIVTHPELFAILRRAGIDDEPQSLGVEVVGRRVFDSAGAIVGERPLPQILTGWGRLYDLLHDRLPAGLLSLGCEVTRIEERTGGVAVHLADGSSRECDLAVGADGLFSTVRSQFLPAVRPHYAGYVAWRGLAEEAALSPEAREALMGHFCFSLPPGEQMLGYPVSGSGEDVRPGRRRFNFVWYRPADEAELGSLLTGTDGVRHPLSIPPTQVRPEIVAGMRTAAAEKLAPAFAEAVARTEAPFLQAILDVETSTMSPGRRVAILGDAAFVARPHVGMGVTKAAADAAALADCLVEAAGDVPAALADFDRRRCSYGAAIVERARALGAYMQAQRLSAREREQAERHRRPEAVMAETAVAPVPLR